MDVTMETSPAIPSLSQSLPASPTGSRKRSFQEIDDAPTEKPSDGEKQDNHAPREHGPPTSVNPSTKTSTSESNQPGTIVDGPAKSAALDNVTPAAVDATKETTAVGSVLTMPTPSATTPAAPSTPERSAATSTAAGPNKRRKLSPASKEAKRLEKEAKERQKMEEKAKKEEEKRAKEEEKRKREAGREEERKKREEKRKIKEEEKAAKEEEKRKKEEEKLKKERSQMRLNAFFMKPAAPASTQSSSANASSSAGDGAGSNAPGNESAQKVISDYEREFPEFFVQSHTKLAPQHRFERDSEALEHIREKIDGWLKSGDSTMPDPPAFRPSELFRIMPYKRRRGRNVVPVREILLKLQNYYNTIDLTADGKAKKKEESNPLEMLKKVPMKILKYYEDVRPPYQGTFTKRLPESTALKLCRNPFHRGLPETNYDYDSEAEWEEPEEGEDLDSEGEEEISEDDDDDMEGFLDDDDDNQADGKRRLIVGDLEPVCSGIRWEENGVDAEFNSYRIEVISDTANFPIDPFSTAYWQKPRASDQGNPKHPSHAPPENGSVSESTLAAVSNSKLNADATASAAQPPAKAKRPFPPEQLDEFKQVVEGSDLTKTGLIEVLKKRFPKVSKDVLKDTLNSVAVRVGQKEAEKKWTCI